MHKKHIALLLATACVVYLCCVFAPRLRAEALQPHSQKVDIDGTVSTLPSYIYKDENYVKLRDLAFLLTSTSAEFNPVYSTKTGTMTIEKTAYRPIGTEMQPLTAAIRDGRAYDLPWIVGNEKLRVAGFLVDGHFYFRLRDIGKAVNLNMEYDTLKKLVRMRTRTEKEPSATAGDLSIRELTSEANYQTSHEANTVERGDGVVTVTITRRFPTPGYSLRATGAQMNGQDLVIHIEASGPPADRMLPQVITYVTLKIEVRVPTGFKGAVRVDGVPLQDLDVM